MVKSENQGKSDKGKDNFYSLWTYFLSVIQFYP